MSNSINMQSSTHHHHRHYFTDEFNENLLFQQPSDDQLFFSSDPVNEQFDNDDDYPVEDVDVNDFPETFNGMETGLAGLQIKGKVRTLSPVLFYQTNTRYLIMSHNQLKSLPAEIGNLVNLVHLDLSHNRLKTLPSQIGDLIQLKRLYLESNCLKNLPYELGKLDLEELGLSNNPLGDQILSLFARPNGTYEVMNFLREKWTLFCSYTKMSSYKMPLTWNEREGDSNV